MPDSTINGLTAVLGTNVDQTADQFPIWVNSASTTRKISRTELFNGPAVGGIGSAIRAAASDYAAVSFDGATTATRIVSACQALGTGDFSLWSRFRVPTSFASNPGILWLTDTNTGTFRANAMGIYLESTQLRVFRYGATPATDNRIATVASFLTNFVGQVVDVVVTRAGNTLKIYINGTDTAYTETSSGTAPAWGQTVVSDFALVGAQSSANIFTGRIYRSVVFNRALSATDVTELITTGVNPADQWGTQTQVIGYNPAVLNGGFETNLLNAIGTWATSTLGTSTATIDTSGSFSRTGTNAGKLTLDASSSYAAFQCNNGALNILALNKRYRISFWARKGATSGVCGVQLGNFTSGSIYGNSGLVLTTSYSNTVIEIISSVDGAFSLSRQSGSAALSEIYLDDIEVTRIGAIVDLDFTVGGGTTAFDRSTNGLNGTLFGGVSWTMPSEGQYINGPSTITGDLTVGTTLGVTGVSTFAAGTALLPAITTTGDTNTGIYYPAADTFAVTTGGTERYRVDASGRFLVGGATSIGIPNGAGTTFFPLIQTITNSGSAAVSAFVNDGTNNRRIGLFVDNDNGITGISVSRSGGSVPFVYRDVTEERLRIDTSGNVGIGVTTFGTSAAKVLGLANATAPSTSPAGMGQLYVEAGALKYRGSSGTVTTIANA